MDNLVDVFDFVSQLDSLPVVDVRTASEFERGHIPNALNFPLFSDEERAEIGTIYKQMGRLKATQTGLEMVGPRLSQMIDRFRSQLPNGRVLVHCWRGGMRSSSVAWLMDVSGSFEPSVLKGGYKAYRNFALQQFAVDRKLMILGGMTGSGKTRILAEIANRGGQSIDLEALASHRGSAFGSLGQPEPPTQQQLENDLAFELYKTDPKRTLWLEDESRHIGRRTIPNPLWARMRNAKVVAIERPREERLEYLVELYGHSDPADLIDSIRKIERRLGGAATHSAVEAVNAGDIEGACDLVLGYYDRTYAHGLSKRDPARVKRLEVGGISDQQIADLLLEQS